MPVARKTRQEVLDALEIADYDVRSAAVGLAISPETIWRYLREWGIKRTLREDVQAAVERERAGAAAGAGTGGIGIGGEGL